MLYLFAGRILSVWTIAIHKSWHDPISIRPTPDMHMYNLVVWLMKKRIMPENGKKKKS
jgi:hypothetical protein